MNGSKKKRRGPPNNPVVLRREEHVALDFAIALMTILASGKNIIRLEGTDGEEGIENARRAQKRLAQLANRTRSIEGNRAQLN